MRSASTLLKSTRAVSSLSASLYLSARGFSSSALRLNTSTTDEVKKDAPAAPAAPVDISSIQYLKENKVLNESIVEALTRLGFKNLTPVQSKTLLPSLGLDDLVTKAKTGTGKTLAFGLPIIEQILRKPKGHKGVKGLIIAPTRDLAFQIRDELDKVAKHQSVFKSSQHSLIIKTLVGGEDRWGQIRNFKNNRTGPPSIVVATPGRFLDVIKEPVVADAFTDLHTFVLDEADRLLGEGFREDLVEISDILKELRLRTTTNDLPELKTMLFSATMDTSILEFSKRILRKNQQHIDTVDPNEPETHEKISQSLIITDDVFESYVSAALFIQNESKRDKKFKAIVFLPTVKSVSYFYETLAGYLNDKNSRLRAYQLHGQLRQPVRDRAVKEFRNCFSGVLVASDVGARGMDFPNVTNVIQIGLPMDATNYVHRVGRTARGGSSGKAVMILTNGETRFTRLLKSRNVVVADQFKYDKSAEAEEDFSAVAQRVTHRNSLELVIESLAGFSKSVVSNYRLNLFEMLEGISKGYGKFVGDQTKLPPLSPNFVNRVLALNRREAAELFEVQGGRPGGDDFSNRGGNRGGYRGGDRNDSRGGDRGGYKKSYSRDGGDDRRGGYNSGSRSNNSYGGDRSRSSFKRNDTTDSDRSSSRNDRSSKFRF